MSLIRSVRSQRRTDVMSAAFVAPSSLFSQHAGPSRRSLAKTTSHVASQRRSFVSLNDLAKLSPFSTESKPTQDGFDSYSETVALPFTQQHLFDVVSDVASYEQFVPYCQRSRLVDHPTTPEQSTDERKTQQQFHAELTVGFGSIQERYTSLVTLTPSHSVVAQALPTPLFQRLRTSWTLTRLTQTETQVKLDIEYAFNNPLYAVMAKKAMHKMSSQMIGAFQRRAQELM